MTLGSFLFVIVKTLLFNCILLIVLNLRQLVYDVLILNERRNSEITFFEEISAMKRRQMVSMLGIYFVRIRIKFPNDWKYCNATLMFSSLTVFSSSKVSRMNLGSTVEMVIISSYNPFTNSLPSSKSQCAISEACWRIVKQNNKILQVLANCFVSGTMTLCIRLNLSRKMSTLLAVCILRHTLAFPEDSLMWKLQAVARKG